MLEAKQRRRLKPCPLCKRLTSRRTWVEDWSHGVFACAECAHLRYGQLENEYSDRLRVARDKVRRKRIAEALASVRAKRRALGRKLS